ncbi:MULTISPECIES: YebC/PmpR family DNA-binding transcriptional regulator [Aerococcus]|uniref:Probable transcriptional regulatory protein DBT54_08975 n=4 Tax=Aerococcus TaxID=1375 RepID=A0ABT4C6C4_9LACT|nr:MULTISPECIES: YebC/PmpR family DNA-binding transcriptional regulator [Aerococcus]AMB96102.1 transcriptional regulator [Aerococcus urinae]KAA9217855.1 YebC/PmpR family DNA-binding transcriptional regulator [Aerococcus loyolae]KAA9234475.1 YebC/PmpR family DNA-binding transcriptional regulator [Aerococcus mictus]KAA9240035.1 YebC/PmpR family DNA-binding transcriptional regulator [Aerococcus urinae]KAA9264388.1 YebC/PmpR family DNA-binding transcriptional regulator [Aerococcus loyolae]
MSGHNKWSKIKNTKGAEDAKRAKIFQKLSREIYMAVKQGGPDADANPSLRMVMDKAKAANMPKTNIERAIDKGSNTAGGEDYDEVTYEGYGPNGIAVFVETLTDNTNRTLTNVRTIFNRNGGSLGESGSVAYMFDRKGYLAIEREDLDVDEETMFMDAIDAGAEDLQTSDEVFEIYTEANDFGAVRDALEEKGYKLATSELTMVPKTMIDLPEDKKATFETLIEKLEDDDDVQNVYYNTELDA